MPAPTVFISYSHDSSEHAKRVRGLGASLARDGFQCRIDIYKDTDEDWPTWMSRQLVEADFILCVVTETYERRFRDNELPDVGLGVGWEAGLIRRLLYRKKLRNDRIFPVFFAKADRDQIPLELQGYDFFFLDGPAGYEALLRKLQRRPLHTAPDVGVGPVLVSTTTAPLFARPGIAVAASSATAIPADVSRILKYAPAELIGREHELNLLNAAWKGDLQELAAYPVISIKHLPKVLSFVALGGEGKTSLVAKWAAELAAQGWPGCDAAFAWSFYSQGTKDQTAASSDLFLKEALLFFAASEEDKQFAASNAGAFEKGQRLARIVAARRCLLILDGLEPLQYAPTSPTPGELKDQGIAALLKGLATANHGLCIVTTRYSLPDLKAFWQTTAPEVTLLRLSRDAGVHLLKTLGVNGTTQELEAMVEDVKGHALTLALFGGFLKRAFHGDIRQRDRVKFEKADEKMDGGHAFRTMAAYEQWLLRDGGDEGRREVAVLRLMGLFDRPADAGCLAALRSETIPGLTEPLTELAEDDWEYCLSGLETAKLLTVNRDASGALVSLDAHPHLREYFARQLRMQQPDAWRARPTGGSMSTSAPPRKKATSPHSKTSSRSTKPWPTAARRGCNRRRVTRFSSSAYAAGKRVTATRNSAHSVLTWELSPASSSLRGLASLPQFPKADQGWMLAVAAFTLRALGRMPEALESMRAALEMRLRQKAWKNAAINASNLSELELTLGELAGAVVDAEQSVTYADADRSDDVWQMFITSRTTQADALHQTGRRAEAETRFREAEQAQKENQPNYPLLYSLSGFRYCDLLLAAPERTAWQHILSLNSQSSSINSAISDCRSISQRAGQTLEWMQNYPGAPVLTLALDHLTVGRAALYATILERSAAFTPIQRPNESAALNDDKRRSDLKTAFEAARRELDAAVDGLRRAGTAHYIPAGLLTRAWCCFAEASAHKLRGDAQEAARLYSRAQEDLDAAWEIAERGPMRLFMADIHLYRARLFGSRNSEVGSANQAGQYPWESPAADLAAAEKLINNCGYRRRDEELADAKVAILSR
jgi:hypothetical protein